MYVGLFLVPYMAVVCGAMLIGERTFSRHRAIALALAAAIAAVAVIPVGRAYLGARRTVGAALGRGGRARQRNSLELPRSAGRQPVVWPGAQPFADGERRLFPGFVAVALAIVALWPRRSWRNSPIAPLTNLPTAAYGPGLLLAFDLSLGFNGFSYRGLYEYAFHFAGCEFRRAWGS